MNHYVRQPTFFLYGEGSNILFDMARIICCLRDSYLRHVLNGFHRNTGGPAVFAGKRTESNKPTTARMIRVVFTSLAHHVTKELIWDSLKQMSRNTAPGVDGIDVTTAEKEFQIWVDEIITAIHRKSYKPPGYAGYGFRNPERSKKGP